MLLMEMQDTQKNKSLNENITSAAYYRQIENQKDLQRHTFIKSIQFWLPFFLLFGLVYSRYNIIPLHCLM